MVCDYGMSSLGTMAIDESFVKLNFDQIRMEIKKITDEKYQIGRASCRERV